MRTEFLCISVVRVASGPRVKLASCKSALNPPVVCSAGRSWGGGGGGGGPGVGLTLCCFVVYSTGRFVVCLPVCRFVLMFFSPVGVAIASLLGGRGGGGGRVILVLFVRLFGLCLFGFVGFLFLLGSGKGCGL